MLQFRYILLPPQGFGPGGPKPEEAYIVAPARNMIYKYILVIPQKKSRFVQFKPAMCFRVIAAIGIGNGLRLIKTQFTPK